MANTESVQEYSVVLNGDIVVRGMRMPHNIKAFIVAEIEGIYNIFVNATLPENDQREAIKHEIRHIENNDFYNADGLCEIEHRASGT